MERLEKEKQNTRNERREDTALQEAAAQWDDERAVRDILSKEEVLKTAAEFGVAEAAPVVLPHLVGANGIETVAHETVTERLTDTAAEHAAIDTQAEETSELPRSPFDRYPMSTETLRRVVAEVYTEYPEQRFMLERVQRGTQAKIFITVHDVVSEGKHAAMQPTVLRRVVELLQREAQSQAAVRSRARHTGGVIEFPETAAATETVAYDTRDQLTQVFEEPADETAVPGIAVDRKEAQPDRFEPGAQARAA